MRGREKREIFSIKYFFLNIFIVAVSDVLNKSYF